MSVVSDELVSIATGAIWGLSLALKKFRGWSQRHSTLGQHSDVRNSDVSCADGGADAAFGEIYRRQLLSFPTESNAAASSGSSAGLKCLLRSGDAAVAAGADRRSVPVVSEEEAVEPAGELSPDVSEEQRTEHGARDQVPGAEGSGSSGTSGQCPGGAEGPICADSRADSSASGSVSYGRRDSYTQCTGSDFPSSLSATADALRVSAQPCPPDCQEAAAKASADTPAPTTATAAGDVTLFALVTNLVFSNAPGSGSCEESSAGDMSDHGVLLRLGSGRQLLPSLLVCDSAQGHGGGGSGGLPTRGSVGSQDGAVAAPALSPPGQRRVGGAVSSAATATALVHGFDSCRVRCNISFVSGDEAEDPGEGLGQQDSLDARRVSVCEGVYSLRSLVLPTPPVVQPPAAPCGPAAAVDGGCVSGPADAAVVPRRSPSAGSCGSVESDSRTADDTSSGTAGVSSGGSDGDTGGQDVCTSCGGSSSSSSSQGGVDHAESSSLPVPSDALCEKGAAPGGGRLRCSGGPFSVYSGFRDPCLDLEPRVMVAPPPTPQPSLPDPASPTPLGLRTAAGTPPACSPPSERLPGLDHRSPAPATPDPSNAPQHAPDPRCGSGCSSLQDPRLPSASLQDPRLPSACSSGRDRSGGNGSTIGPTGAGTPHGSLPPTDPAATVSPRWRSRIPSSPACTPQSPRRALLSQLNERYPPTATARVALNPASQGGKSPAAGCPKVTATEVAPACPDRASPDTTPMSYGAAAAAAAAAAAGTGADDTPADSLPWSPSSDAVVLSSASPSGRRSFPSDRRLSSGSGISAASVSTSSSTLYCQSTCSTYRASHLRSSPRQAAGWQRGRQQGSTTPRSPAAVAGTSSVAATPTGQGSWRRQSREQAVAAAGFGGSGSGGSVPGYLRPTSASAAKSMPSPQKQPG